MRPPVMTSDRPSAVPFNWPLTAGQPVQVEVCLVHAGPAAFRVPNILALFRVLDGNCSRHGQDHVEPDEHADLLDLAQDAIFVRDFQTRAVRYWNRGAERLYGWSAAEAIGQVSDRLLTTHFPQPLDSIQSTLETTGAWEGELVHTARDGRRIVVNSRWALRRDKTGCPAAILEVNTDITQRREADEILHEQAALLDLVPDAVLVRDFSTDRIKHSRR